MADMLKIDPSLVVLGICCQYLSSMVEIVELFLYFLVMATIQDDQQHIQVED